MGLFPVSDVSAPRLNVMEEGMLPGTNVFWYVNTASLVVNAVWKCDTPLCEPKMLKLKENNAKMLRCVDTFEKEEGFAELCSNP